LEFDVKIKSQNLQLTVTERIRETDPLACFTLLSNGMVKT